MRYPSENRLITLIVLSFLFVSCSQFRPPESCEVGGTAKGDKFQQSFKEMLLYDESLDGSPRIHTEEGPTFLSDSPVSIQTESLSSVDVRFCVEERRGGGKIKFDEIRSISEGESIITLDSFEPGSYVIRVIHDEVLIRNLPFVVE